MKRYPAVPRADDAPADLFEGGHLWIQELVDGDHLRFRLEPSGEIRFGGREREFDADSVPLRYRHAVGHVRERLDREALRSAVSAVDGVVFFGVATHRRGVDYDWDRLPSFLGFDVLTDDGFLPPDAVEKIYRRLGLEPVNAFEKEVRAVDFDPAGYDVPDSNWYDGPAAGAVVRNKSGDLAAIYGPPLEGGDDGSRRDGDDEPEASVADLVDRHATDALLESLAADLEGRDGAVGFDALYDRAFDRIGRVHHERLDDDAVDLRAFRSELAARVRRFLDERA